MKVDCLLLRDRLPALWVRSWKIGVFISHAEAKRKKFQNKKVHAAELYDFRFNVKLLKNGTRGYFSCISSYLVWFFKGVICKIYIPERQRGSHFTRGPTEDQSICPVAQKAGRARRGRQVKEKWNSDLRRCFCRDTHAGRWRWAGKRDATQLNGQHGYRKVFILAQVAYQIGEMFVYMSQSQVQDLLEESKENLTGEVSTIGDKIEGLKSQMSDLKTQLYAKLGSAINLEAGDD